MTIEKSPYKGKLFSVLGDSISTFEDLCPPYYPVYYQHERRVLNGLSDASDCWWQMVVDHFGGKLLCNCSYSGGYVVKSPYHPDSPASALHPDRIRGLSKNDVAPDVILLYLGTNDLGYGTMQPSEDPLCDFTYAYGELLNRLHLCYPRAEVICFTLCPSDGTRVPLCDFVRYNEVIVSSAKRYGDTVVDLYDPNVRYPTEDRMHPNREGMKMIAQRAIEKLYGKLKI